MLKKLFLLLLCLGALCFAWAEVSVLSVTDEDKHQSATDFYHTYEYYIMGDNEGTKCRLKIALLRNHASIGLLRRRTA